MQAQVCAVMPGITADVPINVIPPAGTKGVIDEIHATLAKAVGWRLNRRRHAARYRQAGVRRAFDVFAGNGKWGRGGNPTHPGAD